MENNDMDQKDKSEENNLENNYRDDQNKNRDDPSDNKNKENKEEKNNWSFSIAKRLREYAFKSAGLSWMYGNDAAYYSSINRKTNVTIGILAAVSSVGIAGIFALVDNRQCTEPNIGFYVLSAISILFTVTIGILNRYQGAMNLEHRVSDFSEKSAKFGSLYRRINNQFNTQDIDRENAHTLLEHVERRFEELDREKPFLRNKTIDEWGNYIANPQPSINKDFIITMPEDLVTDSYKRKNKTNLQIRNRNLSNPDRDEDEFLTNSNENHEFLGTCAIRINAT